MSGSRFRPGCATIRMMCHAKTQGDLRLCLGGSRSAVVDADKRPMGGYGPDEEAPPFVASTVNGQRLSLTSFRGRVVVLTFWATWCQPCRDEMKAFERLHRDLARDGLAIIGINTREDAPPHHRVRAHA